MVGGFRAVERCDALKRPPYSEGADLLFRPYLSAAHDASIAQLGAWMAEAGMTVRLDPAGNVVGRYSSIFPVNGGDMKSFIIASHIDSVRDGGAYDGPLGVMLGIEVVAALNAQNIRLPFAIEIYAFGDEEGSRFPASMLCSRAVCGQIDDRALDVADRDGVTLAAALESFGLNRETFLTARCESSDLIGYLEAHIGQGPVLEAEGLALGVVTSIAGQKRFEVTVTGVAGHAGTNAMALRKDALTAAAEMVLAVEAVAQAGPEDLVATVGRMTVGPNAPNVVPGEVVFTIDVRAGTEAPRDQAADAILQQIQEIAARRGTPASARLIHDLPAAPCDASMIDRLSRAVTDITGQAARPIVSGAGHDAMAFAAITPTAMLFIRCKDGISHNPLEAVDPLDADLAFRAMLAFVIDLGNTTDE